jgi:hypothetical protein
VKTLVNCFMPAIYDGEPGALGLALTIFLQGKNLEMLHHVKKKLEMVVLLGRSTALGGRGGGGESLQQERFSSSFLSPSSTTTEFCDCLVVFIISLIDLMAGL